MATSMHTHENNTRDTGEGDVCESLEARAAMRGTDPSKFRQCRIEPTSCALLDFRHGPAPSLGLYGVFFVAQGVVCLETLPSEAALDALASERAIDRVPLHGALSLLDDFAQGAPVDLVDVPVALAGPPFFVKAWAALREVRRGEVCSYAQLAGAAGSPRATRAIGQAMASNPLPLVVPCHRVLAGHGQLGGYTGGTQRKRALLSLEGVVVDGDHVRPRQLTLGAIAEHDRL